MLSWTFFFRMLSWTNFIFSVQVYRGINPCRRSPWLWRKVWWWMIDVSPSAPAPVPAWVHTPCIPPSVWVWLPTPWGEDTWVSTNHSRRPSLYCEISTNQDSSFYSRRERCYWPVLTFLREKTLMKCLTCLGTGRIHSIQALCIRWCHCKLRQNLQQMRKNQNHRSQSGEQLLSKCLNPGKVTSKREQNLTQSFR